MGQWLCSIQLYLDALLPTYGILLFSLPIVLPSPFIREPSALLLLWGNMNHGCSYGVSFKASYPHNLITAFFKFLSQFFLAYLPSTHHTPRSHKICNQGTWLSSVGRDLSIVMQQYCSLCMLNPVPGWGAALGWGSTINLSLAVCTQDCDLRVTQDVEKHFLNTQTAHVAVGIWSFHWLFFSS